MRRVYNPYIGWLTLPEKPRRIVSLNPSATEALFSIGSGDVVIGTSSWCRRPREAVGKPKVGSYMTVNLRLLEKLRPDLVITSTGVQRNIIRHLRMLGFPIYPIAPPKSVFGIMELVLEVGGLIGEGPRATEVVLRLTEELDDIRGLARRGLRPTVYVEMNIGGPVIPAYYSHVTSALSLAGFHGLFEDIAAQYLFGMSVPGHEPLDIDTVVRRDPDLIVYESKSPRPTIDEFLELAKLRGWMNMRAVGEGRILLLPVDTLAHHGPSFLVDFKDVGKRLWRLAGQAHAIYR